MHYFCDSLQEHAFHYFSIVSFPKCTRTLCTGLCEYALHNTIQSEKQIDMYFQEMSQMTDECQMGKICFKKMFGNVDSTPHCSQHQCLREIKRIIMLFLQHSRPGHILNEQAFQCPLPFILYIDLVFYRCPSCD